MVIDSNGDRGSLICAAIQFFTGGLDDVACLTNKRVLNAVAALNSAQLSTATVFQSSGN